MKIKIGDSVYQIEVGNWYMTILYLIIIAFAIYGIYKISKGKLNKL